MNLLLVSVVFVSLTVSALSVPAVLAQLPLIGSDAATSDLFATSLVPTSALVATPVAMSVDPVTQAVAAVVG